MRILVDEVPASHPLHNFISEPDIFDVSKLYNTVCSSNFAIALTSKHVEFDNINPTRSKLSFISFRVNFFNYLFQVHAILVFDRHI